MSSTWSSLLNEWRDRGNFGLTVPFVFGAMQILPNSEISDENTTDMSFRKVLSLIVEQGHENGNIRLDYCAKVDDLTFAPASNWPPDCVCILKENNQPGYLWVQGKLMENNENTIGKLSELLLEKYRLVIDEERYSRLNGKYIKFSASDLELIKSAASRSDF